MNFLLNNLPLLAALLLGGFFGRLCIITGTRKHWQQPMAAIFAMVVAPLMRTVFESSGGSESLGPLADVQFPSLEVWALAFCLFVLGTVLGMIYSRHA